MIKRTTKERHAFLEGYEECAKFAFTYMSEEGIKKLKEIIKATKIILKEYERTEDREEEKRNDEP